MINKLSIAFFTALFFCNISATFSQAHVTGIYTDFNGYWHSRKTAISTTVPANNHNLLAFTVNGMTYSTGVNDTILTAHGITFISQTIKGLPVRSIGSDAILGVGSQWVSVNGNPTNSNQTSYLLDGINGLNIGTGIFNAKGSNNYEITSLEVNAIGDHIPDIIIPQIGSLPLTRDTFKFIDNLGNTVGIAKTIQFATNNPDSIASMRWNFYTFTGTNGAPEPGGAVNGQRAVRMVTYDLSDFGINSSNYTDVHSFVHVLSGNSDQPFMAYNATSFRILPIELSDFSIKRHNDNVDLTWTTAMEKNNDFFTIEKSKDGKDWEKLKDVKSLAIDGNSWAPLTYYFVDNNPYVGQNYYRLKQTDFDGKFEYSGTRVVAFLERENSIRLFPNPSNDLVQITGLDNIKSMQLINAQGQIIEQIKVNTATYAQDLDLSNKPAGVYYLKLINTNNGHIMQSIIKQ